MQLVCTQAVYHLCSHLSMILDHVTFWEGSVVCIVYMCIGTGYHSSVHVALYIGIEHVGLVSVVQKTKIYHLPFLPKSCFGKWKPVPVLLPGWCMLFVIINYVTVKHLMSASLAHSFLFPPKCQIFQFSLLFSSRLKIKLPTDLYLVQRIPVSLNEFF